MSARRLRGAARRALSSTLALLIISASLPPGVLPSSLPVIATQPAAAETLASPRFISAALMANGHVGLLFQNVNGSSVETRFVRYTDEHELRTSVQLSTAGPWYPQLARIGSTLVAAYVDTRAPNAGKLVLRTSTDNGATWTTEATPFGTETFNAEGFAPRLVASRDGTTLYVFHYVSGQVPKYRYTTDLSTWTTAANAGDGTMRVPSGNNCGSAGQECYRAHAFGFMETATSNSWVYVAKSDAGWGQSGRGTQVGTLGGSWSTQVDHEGSGGISGGGDSTATTFVGRSGDVYYIRATGQGESLYYKRSTDGGASWGARVVAYVPDLPLYVTAAPVGLYVPTYTRGEQVWFAGFGGSEDTARVIPLWSDPKPYVQTGTVRLFGSAGSDIDAATKYPYNFGEPLPLLGAGGYTTSATDLALPGRVLPLVFGRTYNSASTEGGALGLGWTHSYEWSVVENGDIVTIIRGSGQRDRFTRNTDGTYAAPVGVFDTLTKNANGSFTLTTREQIKFEFASPRSAYADVVISDSPAGFWSLDESGGLAMADQKLVRDGAISGGVVRGAAGIAGTPASTFDGTSGYATTPSATAFNFGTADYTVEAWVYRTGAGANSWPVVISKRAWLAGNEPGWSITLPTADPTKVAVHVNNLDVSGAGQQTASGLITANAWHHIALVYTASDLKGRVYVDGTLALTTPVTDGTTGATSSAAITVGRNNAGTGDYYAGRLDEVAIYPSALSAARITAHYQANTVPAYAAPPGKLMRIHEPAGNEIVPRYTAGRLSTITDTVGRVLTLSYDASNLLTTLEDSAGRVVRYGYDAGRLASVWDPIATAAAVQYPGAVLADSPAAYWRLGESSGTAAADAGPNGLTGTYSGGYTLGVTGAIAGDSNTAVTFNGSNAKVTAGTTAVPTGGAARSIEAWIKPSGTGGTVLALNTSSGQKFILLTLQAGGTWYLFTDGVNGANNVIISGAELPPLGVWSHVVFVFDGAANTWRYYLNAVLTKSGTFGVAINTAALSSTTLGERLDVSQPFSGTVDEAAVYGAALSGAQIAAHFYGVPSWRYGYDGASRHLTTVTDPDARVIVTNTYGTFGRLATQKDGLNNTSTFGYAAGQSTVTDPRSHTSTLSYDARSRPIQQDDPVGGTTYHLYFTYDDCGSRDSVTDRNGNRTDYTYDPACNGNLLDLEEPQLDPQTPRFTTTFDYDSKNNLIEVTDAKGSITTHTYHATSNVRLSTTREIDASTTATTKFEYGDSANPGLVTKIIAPRGNLAGSPDYTYSTALTYDTSGNLTQTIDADAAKTTHTYDTLGRRLTTIDSDGYASGATPADHTWTTTYDANDRVLTDKNPLNQTATNTYFGAGQLKTATDRRGNVTTNVYDAAGRLWKVQQKPDPSGQPTLVYETVVGRDANGNATSVTQANGAVTDYAYDSLNRLTTTTVHPSSGVNRVTTLVPDGNGNVLTRTTADSVTTTYTYDNLSRLKTVAATGLSTITYAYDELSRRSSMQDVTGSTTYAYDRLSRLTSAAQPNGTSTYGYDRDSNRTSVVYPGTGGGTVNYVYSAGGRLSSLTDWSSRTSTYTYFASGLADTVSVPGGMTIDYGYDRAQRLTSLTNMVGATAITTHAYTLDAEGNRTALAEFLSGVTTPATTETFGYTYDGLNRLGAVTTTNAETFTLDGASNITARTGPTATYTIDGENRPTSDGTNTFTWSNADRLTGRGSDTFGYDALDRLTSSTVASTARTYAYNGDGLLQSRTQGTATNFLWDAASTPSRLLAQGGDRIIYGLGPLYVIKADGTTRALARDGGKSVRAEVNGSGAVTGSWRYRAYGEINQTSGQTTPSILGYAGQLLDPSGLYYMRARWYDAASGRFLSRDPVALRLATDNSFGYAIANPIAFTDSSGLRVDPVTGGRPPCACVTPVPQKPIPGDIQPAPDWSPEAGIACCITLGVPRGPLTLTFPMPPQLDQILRTDPEDPEPPTASPPIKPGMAPPGFVPRGSDPVSGLGSVWNPQTDEYWRWDKGAGREGPHWDYRDPAGKEWRRYLDGRWEPK